MIIQTIEDIPEIIRTADSLFHYTVASKAVEILLTENLKLSLIEKSYDPIEEESIKFLQRYEQEPVLISEASQKYDVKIARHYISQEAKNAKHLCFCTNKPQRNKKKNTLNDYGFIKQRMWDQYGEKYAGVCLVLSMEELKRTNEKIYWSKRKYVTYEQQINNASFINFNTDYDKDGKIKKDRIREKMVQYLNTKNKDYQEEQEIRAITFEEKLDYIDIANSIKAIIFCPDKIGNSSYNRDLYEYAERKNIELICLLWKNGNVLWDTREMRKESGMFNKDH